MDGGSSNGRSRRRRHFRFVGRVGHLAVGILRQSPLSSGVIRREESIVDGRARPMVFIDFENLRVDSQYLTPASV